VCGHLRLLIPIGALMHQLCLAIPFGYRLVLTTRCRCLLHIPIMVCLDMVGIQIRDCRSLLPIRLLALCGRRFLMVCQVAKLLSWSSSLVLAHAMSSLTSATSLTRAYHRNSLERHRRSLHNHRLHSRSAS